MGGPVALELAAVLAPRAQRPGWPARAPHLLAHGLLPPRGGPRYEAALVAGLVVPAIAAVTCALEGARAPRAGAWSPLDALLRGLLAATGHALVLLVVALVHGARAGICEPG